MVNFVSLFCPKLQKLLKPIYDLTRKGRQFLWEEEQQKAFDEIKHRLQRPPVLHLPDRHGRFQLYSDMSKFATGSALYQIHNRQPKLIAYASKRMPEAAKNYFITELEMCRLAVNIATISHLLKKVDFDAVVDHLAITHIMRSKAEPATTRIKILLELLSPYSFNLYYIKGKDIIILNLGCFTCLSIDHVSLFYDFVYVVSLSFSQTHGLFVLYVIYFTTCLIFRWQKWDGAILAFHQFKYSTYPF